MSTKDDLVRIANQVAEHAPTKAARDAATKYLHGNYTDLEFAIDCIDALLSVAVNKTKHNDDLIKLLNDEEFERAILSAHEAKREKKSAQEAVRIANDKIDKARLDASERLVRFVKTSET